MSEAQKSKRMKKVKQDEKGVEGGGKGIEDAKEGNEKSARNIPSISIPDRSSAEALFRGSGSRGSKETLTPAEQDRGCRSFSQLLAGAMASPTAVVVSSPMALLEMKPNIVLTLAIDPAHFPLVAQPAFLGVFAQGQFGMSHQEALASVTAQAQMQLHTGHPSPLAIPAKSYMQPLFSPLCPTPLQQRMPSKSKDNVSMTENGKHTSPEQKPHYSHGNLKTPSSDGYNWRKYGQKQVKSSDSSRSYYRCTHANCSAKKKVERCHNGKVVEIIYKGHHNHEPPQKTRCKKEFEAAGGGLSVVTETDDIPGENLSETKPSTSSTEPSTCQTVPGPQLLPPSNCNGNTSKLVDDDRADEPDPKRRIKDNTTSHPLPLFKTIKEPKVVVQTVGDHGSIGDGYRWRKYGQKMVKGNPNPRSYYRCTYVGCPARKHVERSSGDDKAFIMTYEGKHSHESPTFRGSCDSPGAALASASPTPSVGQLKASDGPDETPSNESLTDTEGKICCEKAKELGGEKALESAQTLLSMGQSSSEGDDAGAKKPNAIQRPLFNENESTVSV